jgi:hypothetical protein
VSHRAAAKANGNGRKQRRGTTKRLFGANKSAVEDLTGEDELFKRLKKVSIERALGAELTEHLGLREG